MDTSKSEFINTWRGGYVENWNNYDRNYADDIIQLVSDLSLNGRDTLVEIGPGGGLFTQRLTGLYKSIVAVDVIPQPAHLKSVPTIKWLERNNHQFDLQGINSESVDFVFSFGCFCHLSFPACASYMTEISRVMKSGGCALIMFGKWNAAPCPQGNFWPDAFVGKHKSLCPWFYQTEKTVQFLADESGLTCENIWPWFRDVMAVLRK